MASNAETIENIVSIFGAGQAELEFREGEQHTNIEAANLLAQTALIPAGLFAATGSKKGAGVALVLAGVALYTGVRVFNSDHKEAKAKAWNAETTKAVVDDVNMLAGDVLMAFSVILNQFKATKLAAVEMDIAGSALTAFGLGFDLGIHIRKNARNIEETLESIISAATGKITNNLPSTFAPTVASLGNFLDAVVILNSGITGQKAGTEVTVAFDALKAFEASLNNLLGSAAVPTEDATDIAGATNNVEGLAGGNSSVTGSVSDAFVSGEAEGGTLKVSGGKEVYSDVVSAAGVTTSKVTATVGSEIASETE